MGTLTVSKELKAYFAGIVDGEGSIVITKNNSSSGQIYLRIVVANNNREILELLKSIYGGSIWKKVGIGRNFAWSVSSRKAENFLLDINEWLIIKRGQAEVAFRFLETFEEGKKVRGRTEEREMLKQEMSFLNKGVN